MSGPFLVEYVDGTPLVRIDDDPDLTVGSPVLAHELLDDGELVPGFYDLAFSDITPGVTATVTVTAPSANYAQNGRVITDVPLTGDWVPGVVRGTRQQFNDAPGFISDWKARIHAGAHLGSHYAGNPTGQTLDQTDGYMDPGWISGQGVGAVSAYEIWKLTNASGKRAFNCFAKLIPVAVKVPTSGAGFASVINGSPFCAEKLGSPPAQKINPYLVTFANKNTGVSPNTIDVRFDGSVIASGVQDTSSAGAPGSSAACKVGHSYLVTTGALQGLEFVVSADVTNFDTLDLYIVGVRWVEISPDNGAFAPTTRPDDDVEDGSLWTPADVGLTEIGQPVREVSAGGVLYLHRRTRIPAGAPYGQNPQIAQGFVIEAGLSTASGY